MNRRERGLHIRRLLQHIIFRARKQLAETIRTIQTKEENVLLLLLVQYTAVAIALL